jgi:hypothetical protein
MTTFQAILLGVESEDELRPSGFPFHAIADFVKCCILAEGAAIFGLLGRGNDPGLL